MSNFSNIIVNYGFRPARGRPARTARPVAPLPRSYDRRPPILSHPKKSLKREYNRREELPPRSRVVADYGHLGPPQRDTHLTERVITLHVDTPPSYREIRPHDYEQPPVTGSKCLYAALDDIPPRYADVEVRQSCVRMDYEMGGGSSQMEMHIVRELEDQT